MTAQFQTVLDTMVTQFVREADQDHDIHEPKDLEAIMRRSVLNKNPTALSYCISEMYRLTGNQIQAEAQTQAHTQATA